MNIELNLRVKPWVKVSAILQAIEQRDGFSFAHSVDNHLGLAFVLDNYLLLQYHGMYETALLTAYQATNINFKHWQPDVLRFMFKMADKRKIQALGLKIPKKPVLAYRGVAGTGRSRRIKGLSWTLSLDIACWFALRFDDLDNPAVFQCTFRPEDIYIIHNDRNEQELIGNPQNPIKCKLSLTQIEDAANKETRRRKAREAKWFKSMAQET